MDNLKNNLVRAATAALDKFREACEEASNALRGLLDDEKDEAPKSGDDLEHKGLG